MDTTYKACIWLVVIGLAVCAAGACGYTIENKVISAVLGMPVFVSAFR